MKSRVFLLFVCLCSIPFQTFAADKWTAVRSANFTLVGNATEAQIRSVAVELEQFRDAFTQFLGLTSKAATINTTVLVFKSEESYRPFKSVGDDGRPAASTGYFQPAEDSNYMVVTAGVAIPRSVYHQYAHELMRDLPNAIPLWFNEGLAEFFTNFEILTKEKEFAVGKMIPEHVEVLRKGSFMPLDDLFAVDRSSPQYNERDMTGPYHAESWAFVNYLMVGMNAGAQADVRQFLNLLISGKSAPDSLQTVFKKDTKSTLGELERYVRERPNWQGRAATLKEKAAIDKEIKTRGLTEAEAEFYAGDLLLHINALPDAGTHLQQALKLDSKLATAQASMGMLYYREDRLAEALEYLKRSVEIDPKNYLPHYYYAYVLDKNSTSALDDLDTKRAELGKAIELMPQYAPAYELLAYINLTADIDYDGTIDLLRAANKYAPGNQNLRFLFAQTLIKKKQLDDADKTLQSMISNTAIDTSLRDSVRTLINFIARTRETENKQHEEDEANARRAENAATEAARVRAARNTVEPAVAPANEPEQPKPVSDAPGDAGVKPAAPATGARGKSGELIAVTPQRSRPTGPQIKGFLTLVDCRGGLTLTIKSTDETLKLHSDSPDKIQFVSYVASVNASISCGPTPGQGVPVLVTYRPTPGGTAAGEPLIVEFVEK